MRLVHVLWMSVVMCVAISLFILKYEVQSLEDSLTAKHREIEDHQRAIQVMEAEWTFLTDPNRLRHLSDEHLDLEPIAPLRIVDIDLIPFPDDPLNESRGGTP